MKQNIIIFILVVFATSIEAGEMRVIIEPTTGLVGKVEFVDSAGKLSKEIKSGEIQSPNEQAISSINFTAAESASSIRLFRPETTILPAKNRILVNTKQAREVGDAEYQETGLPFEVRNNIAIFDNSGNVVSLINNLPCTPISVSENANKFLCYYIPDYDPDGRVIRDNANEEMKSWALYIYEFDGSQWNRTKFTREGDYASAKLSPNGQWLALLSARSLPTYTDLLLLYDLSQSVDSPPAKIYEGKKYKNFTRIGNTGEVIIEKIRIRIDDKGQPVREVRKTEVIHSPEKK